MTDAEIEKLVESLRLVLREELRRGVGEPVVEVPRETVEVEPDIPVRRGPGRPRKVVV